MDAPQGWTLEEGGKALVRTLKFKDFGDRALKGKSQTVRVYGLGE